jgi:hypothetical protein
MYVHGVERQIVHGGGPVAKRVGARDAACNTDLAEQT